mgnify:CR=1 FL=1
MPKSSHKPNNIAKIGYNNSKQPLKARIWQRVSVRLCSYPFWHKA